ncbi:hypothetical protein vseg_008603 [Gypsophila vaccaria]
MVQVERGNVDGRHGYVVSKFDIEGKCTSSFYPFSGASSDHKSDPRLSFVEGARDVAVLEAMLESGKKQGAVVTVKRF